MSRIFSVLSCLIQVSEIICWRTQWHWNAFFPPRFLGCSWREVWIHVSAFKTDSPILAP